MPKGKKLELSDLTALARTKNGRCLSQTCLGSTVPVEWQCDQGHRWMASYGNVLRGTWCKTCFLARRRGNIGKLQEYAQALGGACLTTEYVNSTSPVRWQCRRGHEWEATPASVMNGSWCQKCWYEDGISKALFRHSIDDAKSHAISKGGECLAESYKGIKSQLQWRCANDHVWSATFSSVVQRGTWCIVCANNLPRTIEEACAIATERSGRCLSPTMSGNKSRLLWECADGHQWSATFLNVRNGSWCPHCTKYLNEERCRYIFEKFFGARFPKRRDVLGKRFELDGYNEELNIAFEYHGQQHYKIVSLFSPTQKDLESRVSADMEKMLICRDKGIRLVVIPYTAASEDKELEKFISSQLREIGIQVIEGSVQWADFYSKLSVLREMRELAEKNGGKCLSTIYAGSQQPLEWECSKNHRWFAPPNRIKNGAWCPACTNRLPVKTSELQEYARRHRGELLSESYDASTAAKWKCEKGHTWTAPYSRLKQRNSFCPKCAATNRVREKALGIGFAHGIAKRYEGNCLSSVYTNSKAPLLWSCVKGHEFEKSVNQITSRGSWCPACSREAISMKKLGVKRITKLSIQMLQQDAQRRNGELLSTEYVNNHSPLQWRCHLGHDWSATGATVRLGIWCPVCEKMKRSPFQ